jgi:hypothetical protein
MLAPPAQEFRSEISAETALSSALLCQGAQ